MEKNSNLKELESGNLEIPGIDIRTVAFKVKGVSPLIVNHFSEKTRTELKEKVEGKAKKGREVRVPEEIYENCQYWFKDGIRSGVNAVMFKASMVRAGNQLNMKMTNLRKSFFVLAEDGECIEIKGDKGMRTDTVRLKNGSADVRTRACFEVGWEANVLIEYNANCITAAQLGKLLMNAGWSCGIGEWRPEKCDTGSYGRFAIVN